MNGILSCFWILLFSNIGGTIAYLFWYLFKHLMKEKTSIVIIYRLLKIVICSFFLFGIIFFVYVYKDTRHGYITGVMFFTTYTIRTALEIIGTIWLMGVMVNGCFYLKESLKLRRLQKNLIRVDKRVWEIYQTVIQEMRIRKKIQLLRGYEIPVPMITGCFHVKILVPDANYSDEEWKVIFTHELTHYKQKDLLWKKLTVIIAFFNWYNVIVQTLAGAVEEWSENSCDWKAGKKFGFKTYFTAILNNVEHAYFERQYFRKSLVEDKKSLEKRILTIKTYKKPYSGKTAALITALFITIINGIVFAVSVQLPQLYTELYTKTEYMQREPLQRNRDERSQELIEYVQNGGEFK